MNFPLSTLRDLIPYAEDYSAYAEVTDGPATEATRTVFVPWTLSRFFEEAILPRVAIGSPAVSPDAAPFEDDIYLTNRNLAGDSLTFFKLQRRQLLRLDPEAHPRKPWLHACKTRVTGVGAATHEADGKIRFVDGASDGVAKIEVTYRKLPYQIGIPDRFTNPDGVLGGGDAALLATLYPDDLGSEILRYVSREWKPASDQFTIPGTQLQEFRGGAGGIIAEPLPKNVPKTHIVYTWHMVPEIPLTAGWLRGHVQGRTDAAKFDRTGLAKIEGANERFTGDSLYLYPEIGDPYPMVDGTEVRDIKYHVIFRRPGSNFVFRPSLLTRGIDTPELPPRFQGWTLAFRRLPAGDPDLGTVGQDLPHKPGNTSHPYGNLHSLFGLYVDGPAFVPVRTNTG